MPEIHSSGMSPAPTSAPAIAPVIDTEVRRVAEPGDQRGGVAPARLATGRYRRIGYRLHSLSAEIAFAKPGA